MTEDLYSIDFVNLPTPVSRFIGRDVEARTLKQLVLENRLVTITGPGGSGKTRLALRVSHDLLGNFNQAVWFIELASLIDSRLIPEKIVSTLKMREEPGRSIMDSLASYLGLRPSLLVIDNCEHLISACAELSHFLLHKCPDLHILATSRELLGTMGEVTWAIPPLSLPELQPWQPPVNAQYKLKQLKKSESAQLFIARAVAHARDFEITTTNAGWVAEICHHLDGLPLAIELAAAQVRSLSVEEIAQRLDNRFQLLTGGARTAPLRQQTLAAALDWSYELLSTQEQEVLQRLSVFAGGATLKETEIVCFEEGGESANVLKLLSQLVDKSLVIANRLAGSETRYHLLETIREYALAKLRVSPEIASVKNRQLDILLQLVEEAEVKMRGGEQAKWVERLEEERDNLRAALGWALESQNADAGLRLASGLELFWLTRGYSNEGIDWLEKVLAQKQAATSGQIAKAMKTLGGLLLFSKEGGNLNRISQVLEESLKLYQELGDQEGIAWVLNFMGIHSTEQEDFAKAKRFLNESLVLRRTLGDPWGIAQTMQNFASISLGERDYTRAKEYSEETIAWFQLAGNQRGVARTLGDLADIAHMEGDLNQAILLLSQSLSPLLQFGDKWSIVPILETLAVLESEQGNYVRAARLFGATETLRQSIAMELHQVFKLHQVFEYENNLTAVREKLSEAEFTLAWDEGSALTLEQILAFVLNELDPSSLSETVEGGFGSLTPRERETALLIAGGKSNREVAEAMTVSVKTVESYVTRILRKLGFNSRVQIATWAIENDLN